MYHLNTSDMCPDIPQCPVYNIHNVSCTPFYMYMNKNLSCTNDVTSIAINSCCASDKNECCTINSFPLIITASVASFLFLITLWFCCALYSPCPLHKYAKKSCTPCANMVGYEPEPDFNSIQELQKDKEKQ